MVKVSAMFRRFLADECGQDLIEYGLLASIIGIAGYLVLPLIGPKMDAAFRNWGTQTYNIWVPDDPVP
jgi:Flp pilus assembly pilin Flp